jgi:hypothetical protein
MIDNVLQFKRLAPEPQPESPVDPVTWLLAAALFYGYAIARAQSPHRTSDTPPRYEAEAK